MAPPIETIGATPKVSAALRALTHNLSAVRNYANEFTSTVMLSDRLIQEKNSSPIEMRMMFGSWQDIAARSGVVTLYNFRMALNSACSFHKSCNELSSKIDHKMISSSKDIFLKRFPHTRELRQAILHQAELHSNDSRFKQNAITKGLDDGPFKINGGTLIVQNLSVDRTFKTSFDGKLYEYDLTIDSIEVLLKTATELFKGFEGLRYQPPRQ